MRLLLFLEIIDYNTCSLVGGHCSHFCLLDPGNVYLCECPDTMKAVKYSNGQVKCQCPTGQFFWHGLCRYSKYGNSNLLPI